MRFLAFLFLVAFIVSIDCQKRRNFLGDFEFAEETNSKAIKDKNQWTFNFTEEFCKTTKCKRREVCIMKSSSTAMCVPRSSLKKNIRCTPCAVVKPSFLCGSDNKTYSSSCRLNYHNCMYHNTVVEICKGLCPCDGSRVNMQKNEPLRNKLQTLKSKENTNSFDDQGYNFGLLKNNATPNDIKLHNKNMKLLKKGLDNVHNYNEVLIDYKQQPNGQNVQTVDHNCSPQILKAMGNRLLDWFSVIMAEFMKRHHLKINKYGHAPVSCKNEVSWMFQHLDNNHDSILSPNELYDLENDRNELCLRSYLHQCGINEYSMVTMSKWCRCFRQTERPCIAMQEKITSGNSKSYVPECDEQGYYRPKQCAINGICWCVDKHGVQLNKNRTRRKLNCDDYIKETKNVYKEDVDDEDDDDFDIDMEGSGYSIDY